MKEKVQGKDEKVCKSYLGLCALRGQILLQYTIPCRFFPALIFASCKRSRSSSALLDPILNSEYSMSVSVSVHDISRPQKGLSNLFRNVKSLPLQLPQEMPLLAVGPLGAIPSSQSKNVSMEDFVLSDDDEVTTLLDQQPPSSVLYIAFGTTGLLRLSKRHVLELAEGLQRSQQRFVWALRAPPDVQDIDDALPPGFKESTSGRGLLLRGWAPQKLILSHPSTGGFLSSCGWNSAVESLSRGVPIIGWPSFADQPTVCRVLALSKLGIELPLKEDFFVSAEVIADAITVILVSEEGTAMRQRAAQCKVSIAAALAPGGTSFRSVEDFCELIESGPT